MSDVARDMLLAMIDELEAKGHIGQLGQWSGQALRQYVGELAAANQRAADSEAEVAQLREAIRLARRRDYDGGPCWCMAADKERGYHHDSACATLRALLAAQPERESTDQDYDDWVERLEPHARQRVEQMYGRITELGNSLREAKAAEAERGAAMPLNPLADPLEECVKLMHGYGHKLMTSYRECQERTCRTATELLLAVHFSAQPERAATHERAPCPGRRSCPHGWTQEHAVCDHGKQPCRQPHWRPMLGGD